MLRGHQTEAASRGPASRQVDLKIEICKQFFRKLQKLELLEEVEESKEEETAEQSRASSSVASQRGGRVFPRLRTQMSLIQRDPETEFLSKAFRLKAAFQENMLATMGENLQLNFIS